MLMLLFAVGCLHNSCQQLCKDLQKLANDCGYEFTSEDLQQCYQDHRGGKLEKGELGDCRDIAPDVETDWTCDDFAAYFDETQAEGD